MKGSNDPKVAYIFSKLLHESMNETRDIRQVLEIHVRMIVDIEISVK